MFKFLKQRKAEQSARKKIGVELHRQIKEAFDQNEEETAARLQTPFTVGYIYWFVRMGFSTLGFNGEQKTDKHLKFICDGVIPKKLYDIFQRQLAAMEIAKGIEDKNKIIRGTTITPADVTKLFEAGATAGMSDAKCCIPLLGSKANNLKRYLLGEKISHDLHKYDGI